MMSVVTVTSELNEPRNQKTYFSHIFNTDSTLNFKPLTKKAIFCGCTVRFVSDLVGHSNDRFSRDAAQLAITLKCLYTAHCMLHVIVCRLSQDQMTFLNLTDVMQLYIKCIMT